MRLLHVYSGNLFGGIETMLLALAEASGPGAVLAHEFALCFDERLASELRAAGAAVHLLGPVRVSRPASAHAARQALARVLASGGYDRVICHAPWAQALFGGVARRHRVPLVFWAHDRMTGRHWTERLARLVSPELVICNSAFTAQTQSRLYPGLPSAVIHPPARLQPARRERRHVRTSLGTPQDAVVIAQASRCEAWKGHHQLLDALAGMRDVPDWVWWVIGGAQRPDEAAYVRDLRDAAQRAGIADRICWLGERPDVPTLLGAADIYCQPNLQPEPFGLAFVEALAAGLPVVAVGQGGVCEIVDERCGRLIDAPDADVLRATLRTLVIDGELRRTLASAAPARARSVADAQVQSQRLAAVLSAHGHGLLERAG